MIDKRKQTFLAQAAEQHGDRYDYSRVDYVNTATPVLIGCATHGYFKQTPSDHRRGSNCPGCVNASQKWDTPKFIAKAREIHGDRYSYDRCEYTGANSVVTVTCPEHGDFTQRASNHLTGRGCRRCGELVAKMSTEELTTSFISRAEKVHGKRYDYSEIEYVDAITKIVIGCSLHGPFEQAPSNHTNGQGCPRCGDIATGEKRSKTREEFLAEAVAIHGSRYDYSKAVYKGANNPVEVICGTHGSFFPSPSNHIRQATGCPKCSHQISGAEQEIFEWVKESAPDAVQSDRSVLGGKELDIYIPSLNLAIEYNGIYYHDETRRNGKYHQDKTKRCAEKGVRLIHVFEDHWITKKNHVLGILAMALGKPFHIFHARKLKLDKNVPAREANDFLAANHIYTRRGAEIKYGLRDRLTGRLVSVMTFGSPPAKLAKVYEWELVRFANLNGCTVVGGADRLWNHFKKDLVNPGESVLCFSDQSLFAGTGIYTRLGFSTTGEATAPCRWYITNKLERLHRSNFTFPRMEAKGLDPDSTLTQHENALRHVKYSIKDCGSMRHIYKKEDEK